MELFNLLFSGGSNGWVVTALLVCFFWAALVKPERIRSRLEFRIAGLLLALAIIAPAMVQLFVLGHPLSGMPVVRPPAQDMSTTMYALAIQPLLLTLSVILGLDSVVPWGKRVAPHQASRAFGDDN